MSGAPYLSSISSLTFSPDGELFGVNSNMGSPAKTALVTIDPVTGAVALVGELPLDADGLAFSPDATAPPPHVAGVAGISALVLALMSAVGISLALLWRRRAGAEK